MNRTRSAEVSGRRAIGCWLVAVIAVLSLFISPARGEIDVAQFRSDLAALAASPTRLTGSPGYTAAGEYLEKQLATLPNVEWRKHTFPLMTPITESATVTLGGGTDRRSLPVYPFWPAQVRVNATPPEGITGNAVYVADAKPDQLKPAALAGQIAVIEASGRSNWMNAGYCGARAVIVLGGKDTSYLDLREHDVHIPVNLPRFYVPPGELADTLRKGSGGAVTLKASVTWKRVITTNYYVLVKPKQPWAAWDQSQPPAALTFSVPYDSMSMVPDLAPAASSAAAASAGLALLRDVTKSPWERPVMVVFTAGDGQNYRGTREMFLAIGESPVHWDPELQSVADEIAKVQADLDRARTLLVDPSTLNPVADRAVVDRISEVIDTDLALEQDALFRLRMAPADKQSAEDRSSMTRLEDRRVQLNRLKAAFESTPAKLTDAALAPMAHDYTQRLIDRLAGSADREGLLVQLNSRRGDLKKRVELYQWLADALGRDRNPGERETKSRLIDVLVGLDFGDRGVRCGPMFWGWYNRNTAITHIQEIRDWVGRLDRDVREKKPEADWWAALKTRFDSSPLDLQRTAFTYVGAPLTLVTEQAQTWGTPGFSIVTLDDLRLRRDTPTDTLANFDVDAVVPQLLATREFFRRGAGDPKFRGPVELKRQRGQYSGQVVSPALGKPVPDLPREGFIATYYQVDAVNRKIPRPRWYPAGIGVRRNDVADCDALGRYRFEGLSRVQADQCLLATMVYSMTPGSGAIRTASDLGRQSGDIKFYCDIRQEINPLRSVVFDCEEFAIFGLYDPRFLQDLGEVVPLDARRNAEPQRYQTLVTKQMMAGLIEPGGAEYLLFRYGRVGVRLLLLNMPETLSSREKTRNAEAEASDSSSTARKPTTKGSEASASASLASIGETKGAGAGFTAAQFADVGPLALRTARDFWSLNDSRLEQYRKAGVSSDLVDTLHKKSIQQIAGADAAFKADAGSDFARQSTGAWANEARVYDATVAMANDVIRAAIFLLLLCVPFSFCMERLLIGTPNVYKQIGWTFLIFGVMTLALKTFHPAFKISSSPLIIILSFAILFMSIVVIAVVYQKFDTELKRIRSGRGTAAGTSFASAGVLMAAVLLGIANMRKRKFRTALTSITVVLITFAVLCFTSATRTLDATTLPTGVSSSHPGLMLRQRGFRPMPGVVIENLKAVLSDPSMNLGSPPMVERWWNLNAGDPKEMTHLIALDPKNAAEPWRVVPVPAVLGLSAGESALSPIAEVIGPAKFARLEKGETEIVYLSKPIADQLKVGEGQKITVGGMPLEVAGIFDADDFDRRVFMLSGDPLAPLKYSSGMLDAGGRKLDDSAVESLDLSGDASSGELGSNYEHLPASQFVITSAAVSQRIPNSSLRSVAVKLKDEKQVKLVGDELAKRFALAIFAGYDDGVKMVTASNLASVSGAGQVAIPLAIAGMIIFNTMMGSIAERRREIHVYTSLGLAPVHVGALFVAEAMTYGLIGTVFGYVIGQGAGTALAKLGWLGGVTLNYSGTAAMMTMGLILLIVLLSALVPARLASKIAAPSIERSWRVPLPKGDEILAVLPFTINKTAADGALAYLAEYFDAHKEGSIGKFSAGIVEPFASEEQPAMRGIKTVVWLTPFDLGVRQHLLLLIHPGEYPEIYEVQVILQRLSGDDGSWYRMNRTFLTELRKQFLQWRTLTPQRMRDYIEESRRLFGKPVAPLPSNTSGELVRLA